MIILNNWYGRLGNNIQQIFNVISIALFYEQDIYFKVNHTFFDLKVIENYFNKYKNSKNITDKYNFFFTRKLPFPKYIFELNTIEKINLMKKSFLIKDIDKLDENDLVIHIRSGDLFRKKPHGCYIPPPLSYYVKQINKHKYKQIIIVCEDKINPVVNKLLELYKKNTVHNINSLEEDIKIILGATNIISSVGTFTFSLLIFSNHIKYHYGKQGNNKELKDYYKIMKPWINTKEQRDYILSYKY